MCPSGGRTQQTSRSNGELDALDLRPVERWLTAFPRVVAGGAAGTSVVVTVVALTVKRTVDVYLDTEDWRIGRSGFVLRTRHQGDQSEVTLKDTTPAVAGLRRRIEVSEPLPAAGLGALDPEGPVGRRLALWPVTLPSPPSSRYGHAADHTNCTGPTITSVRSISTTPSSSWVTTSTRSGCAGWRWKPPPIGSTS